IPASKRKQLQVGYENVGFLRNCYSETVVPPLLKPSLVAPTFPQIPPTRFILEPPVGGTEKPLFLLRVLPQKNSDFAVLASDDVNLEPVEWRQPGTRAPTRFRVPRPPGARANLRGSAAAPALKLIISL